MAGDAENAPASPCVNVCRLDARQVCAGCGRHIDEIVEWPSASAARKREIITAARQRQTGPDAPR